MSSSTSPVGIGLSLRATRSSPRAARPSIANRNIHTKTHSPENPVNAVLPPVPLTLVTLIGAVSASSLGVGST